MWARLDAAATVCAMDLRRLPWTVRYRYLRRSASTLRRYGLRLLHRHCTLEFEGPVYIGPGFYLDMPGSGTLRVGPGVQFRRGFTCEIAGNGIVTVGAGTVFTYDTVIQCSTRIDIGADCMIGRTIIVDGQHRFRDPTRPVHEQGYDFREVRIGDGATIMSGAVVTASVGDRSVVAANAVVTRPVDGYVLAGGAPARVLERFLPVSQVPDSAAPSPDNEAAS